MALDLCDMASSVIWVMERRLVFLVEGSESYFFMVVLDSVFLDFVLS